MTESTEKAGSILHQMAPEPEAIRLIPEAMARKYIVIPVAREGNNLRVAMASLGPRALRWLAPDARW